VTASPPRPLRVLHCPDLVGGHPGSLARAERELGLASWCIALRPHPFGYPADEVLTQGGPVAVQLAHWRLLARAFGDYDVIHFNFGQSSMPQRVPTDVAWESRFPRWARRLYNLYAGLVELRDLRWLKRLGKRIVVTYQGDDARQGDYLRQHFAVSPVDEVRYYSAESDGLKRSRISTFARWADAMFALNPDLLRLMPVNARFLPYANVDVRLIQPVPAASSGAPIVLHAPSDQGAKGTRFVQEAVNRLKAEGVAFQYVQIQGVPHEQAMRLYAQADLLVDQLLVGWYGGLAVELMALGKPVVSYLRTEDLGFLPAEMRASLPVISATPATVYEVLKTWLTTRRGELGALGARSRRFVEDWHDPLRVAALTKASYEQTLPCAA
jgi:hypothetical protein